MVDENLSLTVIADVVNKDLVEQFANDLNNSKEWVKDIKISFNKVKSLVEKVFRKMVLKNDKRYSMTNDYNKALGNYQPELEQQGLSIDQAVFRGKKFRQISNITRDTLTKAEILELEGTLEELRQRVAIDNIYVAFSWLEGGKRYVAYVPKIQLIKDGENVLSAIKACKLKLKQIQASLNITTTKPEQIDSPFFLFTQGKLISNKGTRTEKELKESSAFELYAVYKHTVVYDTYEKYRQGKEAIGDDWKPAWETYMYQRSISDNTANYKGGEGSSNIEAKFQQKENQNEFAHELFDYKTILNQFNVLSQIFEKNIADISLSDAQKVIQFYKLYYNGKDFTNLIEQVKQKITNQDILKALDNIPNITVKSK